MFDNQRMDSRQQLTPKSCVTTRLAKRFLVKYKLSYFYTVYYLLHFVYANLNDDMSKTQEAVADVCIYTVQCNTSALEHGKFKENNAIEQFCTGY